MSKALPFADDSVDTVYMDNFLEHIRKDDYFDFIDEMHRICRAGARIRIYTPHASGMYALKHPAHYNFFGIDSFSIFTPEGTFNHERYCDARFNVLKEKLLFFHHNLGNAMFLSNLPINGIFNFSSPWQRLMERFQFFGFDEIYYELEVVK